MTAIPQIFLDVVPLERRAKKEPGNSIRFLPNGVLHYLAAKEGRLYRVEHLLK